MREKKAGICREEQFGLDLRTYLFVLVACELTSTIHIIITRSIEEHKNVCTNNLAYERSSVQT